MTHDITSFQEKKTAITRHLPLIPFQQKASSSCLFPEQWLSIWVCTVDTRALFHSRSEREAQISSQDLWQEQSWRASPRRANFDAQGNLSAGSFLTPAPKPQLCGRSVCILARNSHLTSSLNNVYAGLSTLSMAFTPILKTSHGDDLPLRLGCLDLDLPPSIGPTPGTHLHL